MTVMQFLDAAYALLVDDFRKFGTSLMDSLERNVQWAVGFKPDANGQPSEPSEPVSHVRSDDDGTAAQNEASLAELEKMLGGVSFGGGRV